MRAALRRLLVGSVLAFGCAPGGGSGSETAGGSSTTQDEVTTSGDGSSTTQDDSTGGTTDACVPPAGSAGDSTGEASASATGSDEAGPPIASWEAYVAAECAAFADCGCVAPQKLGKDEAACVATRGAELAGFAAQGYTWDGACAAARLVAIAQECEGAALACEGDRCELFHGVKVHGESCSVTLGPLRRLDVSDCGPGWSCTGGLCTGLCDGTFGCGGELCGPQGGCFSDDSDNNYCRGDAVEGAFCDPIYGPDCADGLVCSAGSAAFPRCEVRGAACEPCTSACDAGLYCDGLSGLCVPLRPPGADCIAPSVCRSYACVDDVCAPFSQQGEPCGPGKCADGLKCVASQCVPEGQLGDSCLDDSCAPGLACTPAGVCERTLCFYL